MYVGNPCLAACHSYEVGLRFKVESIFNLVTIESFFKGKISGRQGGKGRPEISVPTSLGPHAERPEPERSGAHPANVLFASSVEFDLGTASGTAPAEFTDSACALSNAAVSR